jgi:hypothetical protein
MTRCVRGARLLDEESFDRKRSIELRIEALAQIFAVGVGGFAVMDNHLHVPLRLDPDVARHWSDMLSRMQRDRIDERGLPPALEGPPFSQPKRRCAACRIRLVISPRTPAAASP